MPIIGLNFTRILAEKKQSLTGNININNNISVKDVQPKDLALGKEKQNALTFTFEFNSKFDPDVGSIVLDGELIFLEDPKKIKEIMDSWKKEKRLPPEIMPQVFNAILTKCNIQSLILSQEINLPPTIPMPKVTKGKPKEDYIG